jgi:DNA-binding beta-propeller fold protein YncE
MMRTTLAALISCGTALAGAMLPVAVSALSDGTLAVLCLNNQLAFANPHSGSVTMVPLPIPGTAVDMVASGSSEQPLLFVAMRGPSSFQSMVQQFSRAGGKLGYWQISDGYPAGLALDSTRGILYISSLQSTAIYRLNLREKGASPHFVTEIRGASRIGPIAVGPAGDRIYAADVFAGDIYEIPLNTRRSSVLVGNLGEPAALALGRDGKVLYVADTAHHCVWLVPLDRRPATPTRFWSSKEPRGVAVDASRMVWVGDRSAKAVFGIAPSGRQTTIVH